MFAIALGIFAITAPQSSLLSLSQNITAVLGNFCPIPRITPVPDAPPGSTDVISISTLTDPDSSSDPTTSGPRDPEDTSTPDVNLPSSPRAAELVETAVKMAWPTGNGTCRSSSGSYIDWKPQQDGGVEACKTTINAFAAQWYRANYLMDCGHFVGAAVRHSIDPDFTASGVSSQMRYMRNSSKWTNVSTDGVRFSMSNLQPGDILAFSSGNGERTGGHIMLWIGSQTVRGGSRTYTVNIASASYQSRTPSLNRITRMYSPTFDIPYSVFRYVGN